jgi:hypothetical protein
MNAPSSPCLSGNRVFQQIDNVVQGGRRETASNQGGLHSVHWCALRRDL